MDELRCTSVGCTNPVTHMASMSTEVLKPWCCAHYESLERLKRAIIERQSESTLELLKLQIQFMRELLKSNGIEFEPTT